MAINVYTYEETGRGGPREVVVHSGLEALEYASSHSGAWIDVETEDSAELNLVAKHFGLHELSVEDCLTPGHFPKLEDYGRYLFIVLRSLLPFSALNKLAPSLDNSDVDLAHLQNDETEEDDRFTRKIALFLGPDFLITFRRKEVLWLDAVTRQASKHPESLLAGGPVVLAHRVIDALVDRLLRGLDFFDDLIDSLEDRSIEHSEDFELGQILDVKRGLASLRQMARDQRAVIVRLAVDESVIRDPQQRRYFKDIDDHSIEVVTRIEKQLDRLGNIRDVYFALANVRLGDTMRILAVITTVAAPLNIVVGLFGMNFEAIPLLHNPYGFWLIGISMVVLTFMTLLYFRRKRWL